MSRDYCCDKGMLSVKYIDSKTSKHSAQLNLMEIIRLPQSSGNSDRPQFWGDIAGSMTFSLCYYQSVKCFLFWMSL